MSQDQKTKQLEKIANELMRLNKNFEKMIRDLESARRKIAEPVINLNIGSEGEPKQSEK